jgi:hypothetical protein
LTSHGQLEGQANSGGPKQTRRDEKAPEGFELIKGDMGESDPVGDASTWNKALRGPYHHCIGLDGAAVRAQANPEGQVRWKAHREFHVGAPFAQVMGPTHPRSRI